MGSNEKRRNNARTNGNSTNKMDKRIKQLEKNQQTLAAAILYLKEEIEK